MDAKTVRPEIRNSNHKAIIRTTTRGMNSGYVTYEGMEYNAAIPIRTNREDNVFLRITVFQNINNKPANVNIPPTC